MDDGGEWRCFKTKGGACRSFVGSLSTTKRNGMQRFDLSYNGGESTSISIRRNNNNTVGYYSGEVHGELGETGAPERDQDLWLGRTERAGTA